MKPYSYVGQGNYKDEECPQTRYTGSNYRSRKTDRRVGKKVNRAKAKRKLRENT